MSFRGAIAARSRTRTLAYVAGGTGLTLATAYYIYNPSKAIFPPPPPGGRPPPPWTPPSRSEMLASLRASVPVTMLQSPPDLNGNEEFDLLIIGGGATGSGVAVDAASRGLKVALVDRGDFSSGAQSMASGILIQPSDNDESSSTARYFIQVHEARSWRCEISSESFP
jgi:glycerol-3-phosphate dehydrogenase